MIYYLNLPQLGYSKMIKSEVSVSRHIVAEVGLEFDLYRVDDDLLFLRDNRYESFVEDVLGLSRIKGDVTYEWFKGVRSIDDPPLESPRLYNIPQFKKTGLFGRFKKQLFCAEHIKSSLEEWNLENLRFLEVRDGNLEKFLLSGGHLADYSQAMKDIVLEGLRRNWDTLD